MESLPPIGNTTTPIAGATIASDKPIIEILNEPPQFDWTSFFKRHRDPTIPSPRRISAFTLAKYHLAAKPSSPPTLTTPTAPLYPSIKSVEEPYLKTAVPTSSPELQQTTQPIITDLKSGSLAGAEPRAVSEYSSVSPTDIYPSPIPTFYWDPSRISIGKAELSVESEETRPSIAGRIEILNPGKILSAHSKNRRFS